MISWHDHDADLGCTKLKAACKAESCPSCGIEGREGLQLKEGVKMRVEGAGKDWTHDEGLAASNDQVCVRSFEHSQHSENAHLLFAFLVSILCLSRSIL